MKNVNAQIEILEYFKYEKRNKDTGEIKPGTCVRFMFCDITESKNKVGHTIIEQFYKGHEVFNKLSKGLLDKKLLGNFEIRPDLYDPMSLRQMLVGINDISLL